jgi:para-nitrobenzyl esterase
MRRITKIMALTGLLAALFTYASRAEDICTTPVKTGSGMVRGSHETTNDTCVWRGIPYAVPPVGELRWKAPQPMPKWEGVRPAIEFGARCTQKGIMEYVNFDPSEKMSEDCLFLNIWRPNKPGKFPVMFWIHGGGYTGGTGNTSMYWGDRMAQAGEVVVVTINYRLGILGFLALPALRDEDPNQSVGSYGSLDQVAALKWVKDNIANFGGDPENITIFGESAGGWSVCSMLATPLAKGLFHKAIIESGGCETSASLEKGFEQGKVFAEKLGCQPDDLACLRKLPDRKLLKVVNSELAGGFVFGPHLDGYFLKDSPLAVIRSGKFNNVPLIAGFNKNETDALVILDKTLKQTTPDQYQKVMTDYFDVSPEEAEKLAGLYPLSELDNSPPKAYGMIATDASLACPTYLGLVASANHQTNVYLYRFEYHGQYWKRSLGAVHSLELPFVFDTTDRPPWSIMLKNRGGHEQEMKQLSRSMQDYWLNFAKTGNPNGPGLQNWPAFKPDSQQLMVFDVNIRSEAFGKESQARCRFWDEYTKHHAQVFETMGAKSGAKK